MGILAKLGAFTTTVLTNQESLYNGLRTDLAGTGSISDATLKRTLGTWFDTWDQWVNLFPAFSSDPTPVAFLSVALPADSVDIVRPPLGMTLLATDLVPLGTGGGVVPAANVKVEVKANGEQLSVSITGVPPHLTPGGQYHGLVWGTPPAANKPLLVATIIFLNS